MRFWLSLTGYLQRKLSECKNTPSLVLISWIRRSVNLPVQDFW